MPQFSPLELQVLKSLGIGSNDPAASAMLQAMGSTKTKQLAGDPAFQAGSKFFGSKFGAKVQSGLGLFGPSTSGEQDLDALIAEAMRKAGVDGGGGSFGGTQVGMEREAALARQAAAEDFARQLQLTQMQQQFEQAQQEKQREFQRQQALEQLKAERQRIYTDMLGTDPVRAVLFAMGIGGEILPGGEQFAGLPPIQGAEQQAAKTQTALQGILGGPIGLGQAGVTGLPDVEKAAAAYSAGQGAQGSISDLGSARTLLTSGFGVGATPGQGRPGLSREEALRRISAVTPQGAF
mgnify:FL=1